MDPARDTRQISKQAYLQTDWEVKHEWINGIAYAMSGGTPLHSAVTVNAVLVLARLTAGSPCRVASADQRVHVVESDAMLYPDVSVICPPWEISSDDRNSVVNPSVVVEVLSPSTLSYDLGAKFEHYRRIQTLQDVLFVHPDRPHVIHYARREQGWLLADVTEGQVELSLGAFDSTELYADLEHVPRG